MRSVKELLIERKDRLEAANRITCPPVGTWPLAADDATIRPKVPLALLDSGAGGYSGRRARIRFDGAGSGATLLCRVRSAPSVASPMHVSLARDTNGARVPVACADPDTATVHLLVELSRSSLEEGHGPDPLGAVAEALFERPLSAILAAAGDEVSIGPDVEVRARTLANRGGGWRAGMERELVFLRRIREQEAGAVHGALASRLEELEQALARTPEVPPLPDASREVARLVQLVRSRAVGLLRFGEDEVIGLIQPAAVAEGRRRAPLMFGVRLRDPRQGVALRYWNPDPPSDEYRIPCPGSGSTVLPRLGDSRDLFGVVDAVLNFTETNSIGVAAYGERPALGTIFRGF
ncbi:MAG: hypothetical protein ACT4PE_05250 [Candidatus Eiseniibacteriota bacterium]